jgi:hypothetical protein
VSSKKVNNKTEGSVKSKSSRKNWFVEDEGEYQPSQIEKIKKFFLKLEENWFLNCSYLNER